MQVLKLSNTQGPLVYELFDKYRVFYKQPSDIETAKNFIQERLNNNESVIFVALSGNETPIGFTQLYPKYSSMRVSKNWVLNDLYVEKAFRKSGTGTALIQAAMDFAKQNGATFVELSTAIDNYTAQNLYEQIGFVRQKPETDFYTYRITV